MTTAVSEILHTKLTPPALRTDRVPRPRLIDQFSDSMQRPLTLVCAPAGYGKSTLLSEWLISPAASGYRVAWYSLDEDDNEPSRFLAYLVYALTTSTGIDGTEILALLRDPQTPSPKFVLTALLSRLETLPTPFVLVLDDFHLVTSKPLHEAMTFLLEHQLATMRLVLTSREDPPFPLARLRGRGQLAEIRADDLRFTPDEARTFLTQMLGIQLSTEQIQDLEDRTEGWIAGLQLAALAMKGHEDIAGFVEAFTGSHRYILDYLTEEALNRQPQNCQDFLLQTSVLGRLNGQLCDAVTGGSSGQQMLEQLERGNLFLIPLDEHRYWYRYHHLFADVLRKRLNPDQQRELHRRASVWFAAHNLNDEAISHAIAAREFAIAARIMEESGSVYFVEGWVNFGMKWADQIPDDVMTSHPLLALNTGMWHGYLGRANLAQKYVEMARAGLSKLPLSQSDADELLGYADTIEALSATINYDTRRAIAAAESALARLPEGHIRLRGTALLVKGYVYQREKREAEALAIYAEVIDIGEKLRDFNMTTRAMIHRAEIALLQGHLREAESAYRALLKKAADERQEHALNIGIAHGELAVVLLEQNRLDEALRSAVHCIATTDQVIPYYALVGYAVSARVYRLTGNDSACASAIRSIRNILESYPSIPARIYVLFATHLWTKDEMFAPFRAFLMSQRSQPTTAFESQLLQLVAAGLLIEDGTESSLNEAFALLEDLRPQLEGTPSMACWIELLVLEALLMQTTGRSADAQRLLQQAVIKAELQGYVRMFIDKGEAMRSLLRAAVRSGRVAYANTLLEAFSSPSPVKTPQAVAPADDESALIEPLSEREREVLRLVVDGASNREIAESLIVSLGTVKKHINNIFLKLDVHSRTQAVAVARQRSLL